MGYRGGGGSYQIYYSGYASHGPSKTGGSTPYSGYVTVNVDVYVDSDPVEDGIHTCKRHIDVLTGTVVATDAAQIKAIKDNSEKIVQSFTGGFFNLIRSELSQRIAESRSIADSRIMQLTQLAGAIQQKTQQMEQDFHRIANRYTNLFNDLDRETLNRIRHLDSSVFDLTKSLGQQTSRPVSSGLSSAVVVGATEQSEIANTMAAAGARQRACQLLQSAHAYLASQKGLGQLLRTLLQPSKTDTLTRICLPIMYLQTERPGLGLHEKTHTPSHRVPVPDQAALANKDGIFRHAGAWKPMDAKTREKIDNFLLTRIAEINTTQDSHAARVAQQIWALWQKNPPMTLPRLDSPQT